MNMAATKTMRIFADSSAVLLLAMASALILINLTSPVHLVQPHDPIFGISLRYLFWIISGMAVLIAFFCLFSNHPAQSGPWVAWFATSFLICRVALYCAGSHGLTGYLGSFSYAFGISATTANSLADMVFAYLLIGSLVALTWPSMGKFWKTIFKQDTRRGGADTCFKILCLSCGREIQFTAQNLGQKIPCPHCKMDIILKDPL
jgi:DNA-directed RNA polymerase subunit RPC12/RpoP